MDTSKKELDAVKAIIRAHEEKKRLAEFIQERGQFEELPKT